MRTSRANGVDEDSWHCGSGETQYITTNKHYFVSHKIHHSWNDRAWQEECADESIRLRYDKVLHVSQQCGMTQHWKIFGICEMQAHIYSPSRQPPKPAKAQHWMERELLFAGMMKLWQHRVSSLMTFMYWQFGYVFHNTVHWCTWERKWENCKYGMSVLPIKKEKCYESSQATWY